MKVKAEKNICAENSGSNSGTIVGVNNGVINYSLPQQPTPSLLYPVIKAMAEIDDKNLIIVLILVVRSNQKIS